ncbi:MAG TPA: hypothetical protein VF228_00895 [Iamia sp.]
MMKRSMKKMLVVVLLATVAVMVLPAAPTAASTGTVTSGSLTVALTPGLTVPLSGSTCTASSISFTATTTTSGFVTLSIPQVPFDYGTPNPHLLVASFTGTYTLVPITTTFTPDDYQVSGTISTNSTTNLMGIYARTGTCGQGTKECTAPPATGHMTTTLTLSGTFIGDGTTVVGTLAISGHGTVSAFGCGAPFSAINGKAIAISVGAVLA